MNAISCLTWVKRGVASSNPKKTKIDEAKLKQFLTKHQTNDEDESDEDEGEQSHHDSKRKTKTRGPDDNVEDRRIIDDYGLDDYSDDEDDKHDGNKSDESLGMSNLTFYTKDEEDPYITKDDEDDDDDDDDEDDVITSNDNLIVVGKVDGEFSSLEVWVYNETTGNEGLYCHHEYILPSCPIAVEWVGGIEGRNLAAVGGLDASLSLWDLDVMDTLDPAYLIPGCKAKKRKQPKAKRTKLGTEKQTGHKDAILGLSWNELQGNILASASVDTSIGLWDLNSLPHCFFINDLHSDKVQTLQWHHCEAQMLLTGSADKTVKVFDCRSAKSSVKSWELSGEVEKVLWHKSSPFCFFSGTSTGFVHYVDIRMDDPIYQLDAHSPASVTDLTICQSPSSDCLLSSSENGSVKVWHVSKESKFVNKKNFKIGSAFCISACPDSTKPLFAVGGENEMKVFNLAKDDLSSESFGWTFEGKIKTEVSEMKKKIENKKLANKKTKKFPKKRSDEAEEGTSHEPEDVDDEDVEKHEKVEKKKAKARIAEKKKKLKKTKSTKSEI